MLKPTIFREYDIRGIADTELLDAGIEDLGRAIGTYVQRERGSRMTVARDCRLSSERLRDAIVRGLKATGCEVSDLGVVPTPLLYYSVFHLNADGGVMITGSHNPAEYNGFKVVLGDSTIHGEAIQDLRRIIESNGFIQGEGSERAVDVVTPYVEEVAAQFRFPRRIKVAADAGNGTAGPVMHRLFQKLDCDAAELYFEMDGRFPNHHPDPTLPDNLKSLIETVKETGAELGLSFDGDGDRLGAVDEHGNIVYGDQLMVVYAREILARRPGSTFIAEVKCSQTMYDDIRLRGGKAIMYKTGHSLIKAKMKQEQAALAGEMSGHMFFADRYYGFDDALYSACRLMEIVAAGPRGLSHQLSELPCTITTPEIRVDCPDEMKFAVVSGVKEHYRDRDVVDVDGVRVLFPKGWGLVRASNTQPVLVLRFEAEDQELLAQYRAEVESVVDEAKKKAGMSQPAVS